MEVLRELDTFLKRENVATRQSLHEAGLDLIRIHLLDTPSTLHRSLLSTNMIENTIRNFRHSSGRVNRWRVETDQAARWLATALLSAEEEFRRLSHYRDLPVLLAHLKTKRDPKNLGGLKEKLPDWLRKEVPQVDEVEDNVSPACVSAGSQAICVV